MEIRFIPRDGALRYQDTDGKWHCANPRDVTYSTITMMATEYWTVEKGWVKIFEESQKES